MSSPLVRPVPGGFPEAIKKVSQKLVAGAGLNSAEWAGVPVALRERAFFSSTVENVRFLQRAQDAIGDFLTGARETITRPDGSTTTALKLGSRAEFVSQLREFALAEGMGPLEPEDAGTVKDITSERRLGLIFDVQTQAANDFGNWQQGMAPAVLNEFPAQRFIREKDVRAPRAKHAEHEDEVRLKTDLEFWLALNNPEDGGFGTPYGPWGYGSGMAVEDVDRDEAEALGLVRRGQRLEPVQQAFNDHLKASVRGLDDSLLNWLRGALGDNVAFDGDKVRWLRAPDRAEDQDYGQQQLSRTPGPDGQRPDGVDRIDVGRIAGVTRSLFEGAGPRDLSQSLTPADATAAGAHVAAVVAGRKPLYHELLDWSLVAARELRVVLPGDVAVQHVGDHLYVYRPGSVRRVLDLAPEAYPGLTLLDRIHRATLADRNGLLLGYGTPRLIGRDLVTVVIRDAEGTVLTGFRAPRATAEHWAAERLKDFTEAYGERAGFTVEVG